MGTLGIGSVSLLLTCLLAPGVAVGEEGSTGENEGKRSGYHDLGLFVGATSKDHEGGDFRSYLIAFPVAVNPAGKWVLYLAPGLEHVNHESEFLIRLGALYAFEIGGEFFLAPQLNLDRTGETAFVYGVSLGRAFGK